MSKEKKIGEAKKALAMGTATALIGVLKTDEVSQQLRDGFIDLFCTMQNKSLERFRGLLAGVPLTSAAE